MKKAGEFILIVVVFSASLFFRLFSLDEFIGGDETKWVCRSINFHVALTKGNLAETYQAEHPGVITMWLGTMAIPLNVAGEWVNLCQKTGGSRLNRAGGPEVLARFPPLLFKARPFVALLTWLGIIIIYYLIRELFGRKIALLSALLIALDPFYLAHSRIFHLDAILTTFMTISVLSLLVYLVKHPRWAFILSGVTAGLAALNKSPGLFLGPFAVLLVLLWNLSYRKSLFYSLKELALLGSITVLVIFALWPALWVNPIGTLQKVLREAILYAEKPHLNFNFFMGEPRADPGPLFYPVAWLFRTTPWVILGSLLSLVWITKYGHITRVYRKALIYLWSYVLLFTLFMTLGAKKFDRYLLPVFPSLDIISAAGLKWVSEQMMGKCGAWLAAALILPLQIAIIWPHSPYYLSYYNPLLGGPKQAVKVLLVGWGEGMEKAAQYLNGKKGAENLHVNTDHISQFAPFFVGHTSGLKDIDPAISDYYVFYINSIQRQRNSEILNRYYGKEEPEYVVTFNGIDYVWIYPNTNYVEPLNYIESEADPEKDLILLDTPSVIAKYYKGKLPVHIIDDAQEETYVVRKLQEITEGRERIWYITYPQAPGDPKGLIHFQISTHAYKLDEKSFPDIKVTLYQLIEPCSFKVSSAETPLRVNFDNILLLEGYGFDNCEVQWGRDFGVTLRWKSLRKPERNYAVFLHLVDDQGHIWGQGDRWLLNDSPFPTAGWEAGEVVLNRYAVSLLEGTPPGEYYLKIGVYDSETGKRLRIVEGAPAGTEYILGNIKVTKSPLILLPDQLNIQHRIEREIAGKIKLLGFSLNKTKLAFGESFTLNLYWQALKKMEKAYTLSVELRDKGGKMWAEGIFPLVNKTYTTDRWAVGEIVWGRYELTVDDKAPQSEAKLLINLLDPEGHPLLDEDLTLTELTIEGRLFTAPEIEHPLLMNLGDKVSFLGYKMDKTEIEPGESLHITLYWQAKKKMDVGYIVFVHLLDEHSKIWSQKDSVPRGGRLPTTEWLQGEIIVDEYELYIKPDTPAGKYIIEVGMYNLESGQRLPVFDSMGKRIPDDRILLGEVCIRDAKD